ncbi:hypothetical protein E0F15_08890 [Frankia sp. B2]|uniref:hypothetical protein n=1 Tax=Frankia TaxID=1854 RepID=UPI0003CFDB80|nr:MULTISPECIES: hypothetical protein [Frankia]ETA04221.1 hypothetical protein CcI6DRAFT_00437 [Frankia sp. CcI6]KDA44561.1 hypothetical protein BMG523Draft_00410 [Frankia sp. BMG5.23]KFB05564.1 hypothetical protein ALLO2DRAFT_01515 [Frankia sp. Allo2]OAA27663.1 hypothetical protein AAY23_102276 [Frankia casuarinae]OHV47637.1 hypothetical protein CgIS1_06510 [Frankia sp. CgIS1]
MSAKLPGPHREPADLDRRVLAAQLRALADNYDAAITATEQVIHGGDTPPDADLDDLRQHRSALIGSWHRLRAEADNLTGDAR